MGEIFSIGNKQKITPEEIKRELIEKGANPDDLKSTVDLREVINKRVEGAGVENMTEEELAHLRDEIAETLMHSGGLRAVKKED